MCDRTGSKQPIIKITCYLFYHICSVKFILEKNLMQLTLIHSRFLNAALIFLGCEGRIVFSGDADRLDRFLDGIVSTVWIVGTASGSKHFFFTSKPIAFLIEYSIG